MSSSEAQIAGGRAARKQAVVLVHGMGEQVPMETLRGFVDAVWAKDPAIAAREDTDPPGNPVWWKPDSRTGSLELSRLTTRAGASPETPRFKTPRTDFYEFYWADCTDANTITQLKDWFFALLWRRRDQVPADVKSAWYILWAATLFFGALIVWKAVVVIWNGKIDGWAATTLTVATAIWGLMVGPTLAYFGDVARYVRAKPPNIAARRAIRERGLALLRAIGGSGQYDRIVLVGHSLGSIIAYDLLKFLWSEQDVARTTREGDSLYEVFHACHEAGKAIAHETDGLARFRAAQAAVFKAMQGQSAEDAWLISDFVTLGSPLAHAQFLLARDADGLSQGEQERRFPISPPAPEDINGFLYKPDRRDDPQKWEAHHAAPFAVVRWTNIYDPAHAILLGDLISGPVGGNFGPGIRDIPVEIVDKSSLVPRLFTHTKYWSFVNETNAHLGPLRDALDLLRRA